MLITQSFIGERPNFFPSLVAMRNTPIVWDTNKNVYRYITPFEAAKLQSFDDDIIFHENDNEASLLKSTKFFFHCG